MSISSLANSYVQAALDGLILSREIQKMIIVNSGRDEHQDKRGHFFVNQVDTRAGRPLPGLPFST